MHLLDDAFVQVKQSVTTYDSKVNLSGTFEQLLRFLPPETDDNDDRVLTHRKRFDGFMANLPKPLKNFVVSQSDGFLMDEQRLFDNVIYGYLSDLVRYRYLNDEVIRRMLIAFAVMSFEYGFFLLLVLYSVLSYDDNGERIDELLSVLLLQGDTNHLLRYDDYAQDVKNQITLLVKRVEICAKCLQLGEFNEK